MPTDPQGNTPPEGANGEQPKYVTAEDVASIVNAAVTNHLKRTLPKEIEALGSKLSGDMKKTLEEFKPKADPQGEGSGKPSPEVAALQAKIDELVAANKATAEKAEKAERDRRETHAYGELRAALSKSVRPEMLDIVTKVVRADGLISFDEEGKALFRVRRSPGAGLAEEDQQLPLNDGIAHFLKSKEASVFLPPPTPKSPQGSQGAPRPSAQQSAGSGVHDRPPPRTDEEKVRRAAEQEAEILSRMNSNPTL